MYSVLAESQVQTGFSLSSGYNRVGLYVDAGALVQLSGHKFQLGTRFYGPDYVFESDLFGVSAGYSYVFESGKWFFEPGIRSALFREKKNASTLLLTEFLLNQSMGCFLGSHVRIHAGMGLGVVLNKYTYQVQPLTGTTGYMNYEFSLGIAYFFAGSADN